MTLEDILLSNSELVTESGCRIWIGKTIKNGYGRLYHEGQRYLTHRIAWQLAHGPIPKRICICHTCDVPACINVEHLFPGSHKDNTRDAIRKGRMFNPQQLETIRKRTSGNKYSLGHKHTAETKAKMSQSRFGNQNSLGFKHTAETNEKNRQHMLGNQHLLGYHHTDSAKAKNSAASKKMWASPEYRAKVMAARAQREDV